jgi:hypothetical protein
VTRRLNITNGDGAAGTLSEAGVEGKILPWRDVLHEGPVDSSLPLEELSSQRARFIAERQWDDFSHVSGDFAERDRVLKHLDYFDEVVLWFEDDLYDQLQLIQLLDFLSRGPAKKKTLTLIQVDGYIPPLSATRLKEMDKKRSRVTAEQLDLAQRAWKAFGSDDPSAISSLLDEKTSALPYLASALVRHLEEFPEVGSGLSRSEREAMTAIDEGHNTPVGSFLEVAKKQPSIFLGDIIFYSYLERLSFGKNPLVTWKDGTPVVAPTAQNAREFVNGELAVTRLGREVLAGRRDWQTINTQTRWLGGVEIAPGAAGWRWDATERVIVRKGADKAGPRKTSATTRKAVKPRKAEAKPEKARGKARKAPRPAAKRAAKRTSPRKK